MFKWLFQGKKIALEKANAKRLEEEGWRREDVAGARERVEYLFKYRTNEIGQPFTFADLEAATASQNPARQVSVKWLSDLTQGQLVDLIGHVGRLNATSDFFGAPAGFNFWLGDFTEESKREIRVTNRFITNQWHQVYDTESVVLQAKNLSTNLSENQAKLYREALNTFVSSADFKSTLAKNLLLSVENSYLVLSLTPDATYKVLRDTDLVEEPFHFNSEKMNELEYLLKEGWDFEWQSSPGGGKSTINLSISVPDGIGLDQVKQAGPNFVQKLLEDQAHLDWLSDHLSKRLDYLLGFRTPDPSMTAHRNEAILQFCGSMSGVLTVGDLRKANEVGEDGQSLSSLDQTKAELVKLLQRRFLDQGSSEDHDK